MDTLLDAAGKLAREELGAVRSLCTIICHALSHCRPDPSITRHMSRSGCEGCCSSMTLGRVGAGLIL